MELALSSRFDPRLSRKMYGVAASAAVHIALLLVVMFGGSQYGIDSGDSPTSKLVLLEAPDAEQRDGVDLPPLPAGSTAPSEVELEQALAQLTPPPSEVIEDQAEEPGPTDAVQVPVAAPVAIATVEGPVSTVTMPASERAALSRQLERLAAQALKSSRAEVTWEQDGRQYSALLIRERANEGTALERVTAQVSAADHGRKMTTLVNLNRLSFSQFTQMVDRWDPMVAIHDDEIVGRFHSNSRFSLLADSRTAPKFLGKVTTTARGFNNTSLSQRRDAEIFRGGLETGTSEIELPESPQPFAWAPRDERARVHELAGDTRIRFFADGSYRWTELGTSQSHYLNDPSEHPVYFIAKSGAALHVEGVVAGKVLLYSPRRVVIEGSITYAHDPRVEPGSEDYLGIVSDRVVEVAPPGITGGGDLEIDAAIFAGHRFVVTSIDHIRSATLRIYGSLAAGTLSATEPRYATKIDYDPRFERQRPPGFPSTNRFEVATEWDGKWTEEPQRAAGN
jgi:hypothetical protein